MTPLSFGLEKSAELAGRLRAARLVKPDSDLLSSSSIAGKKLGTDHPSSSRVQDQPQDDVQTLQPSLDLVRLDDDFDDRSIRPVSIKQLLTSLDILIVSFSNRTTGNNGSIGNDDDGVRSTLLIQIILRSCSALFDSLCFQANWLKDQIEVWSEIETHRTSAASYLIQTFPARSIGLAHRIWSQTKHSIDPTNERVFLPDHKPQSQHGGPIHQSRPSLSIPNLFPILSTNLMAQSSVITGLRNPWSIQFLRLTRHEARLKRKALESVHHDLVGRIGRLVNCLNRLEDQIEDPADSDLALVSLVDEMMQLTSPLDPQTGERMAGSKSEGLLDQLRQLLSTQLPNHHKDLRVAVSSFSPPGVLTRNWPWLISLPMFSYAISTLALRYRTHILLGWRDAKETLKGFISGWVVRPIEDIIQTLKAGQQGTLAIMTKDSLPSELDSLERMVVEFARDKFKWTDDQLSELSESVKAGNLTSVLKVWEQEIKAPIRSAIAGSLVRVLLIQMQKVKVDLSLAMDGIQSILRSQSLTFGAIGVAPSMLICFMFGKLFSSLIRQRIGVVGKGTKAIRKEVRVAMRRIERTLLLITSNPSDDSNDPTTKSHTNNPERTVGFLFLDLHLMRYFAHSPHFPRRESSDFVRQEFLSDIKDLESFHLSWKTKSKLAKRFTKRWGFLVGI